MTINDLRKKIVQEKKEYWATHVPGDTSKTPKPEKSANSADFFFDRKNLRIVKKDKHFGQMKLL